MDLPVRVIVHREGDLYWAEVPAMPGCVTQADSPAELRENLRESIAGWWHVANERDAEPAEHDTAPAEVLVL
jgi:predicted RNase H-like HicB family nuclease